MPRPNATPEGSVVVNVTATLPLDVKVNSLLAVLPGLITLENELTSIGVADGEVTAASSQAAASIARQHVVTILVLIDVLRGL